MGSGGEYGFREPFFIGYDFCFKEKYCTTPNIFINSNLIFEEASAYLSCSVDLLIFLSKNVSTTRALSFLVIKFLMM